MLAQSLLALALVSAAAAAPAVGTVKCDKVHTGVLTLSNASHQYLAGIEGDNKVQGLDTLVANGQSFSQNFDFYACDSPFEKTPAHEYNEGQDLWNGHIALSGSTTQCLAIKSYGTEQKFIQVVDCSYSDDSSQASQFWTLLHNKNGRYDLSYRPSPDFSSEGTYTFTPGTKDDPKVYVHLGSSNFSDYKFTLGGLDINDK